MDFCYNRSIEMAVEKENLYLTFKGLADPQRIEILEILLLGEECNCNLCEKIEMPPSTLAHHLRVLTNANLVIPRREGKWTYYAINKEQFVLATDILNKFI